MVCIDSYVHLTPSLYIACAEVGTTRDEETMTAIFARMRAVAENVRGLRCAGSCACNMCGVAMGRLDAFWEIGFGGCWDVAAGEHQSGVRLVTALDLVSSASSS